MDSVNITTASFPNQLFHSRANIFLKRSRNISLAYSRQRVNFFANDENIIYSHNFILQQKRNSAGSRTRTPTLAWWIRSHGASRGKCKQPRARAE